MEFLSTESYFQKDFSSAEHYQYVIKQQYNPLNIIFLSLTA